MIYHQPLTEAVRLQLYRIASSPNAVPLDISPNVSPSFVTSSFPSDQQIKAIHNKTEQNKIFKLIDNWGGGGVHVFIYSLSAYLFLLKSIDFKVCEHEYINMCPPQLLIFCGLWKSASQRYITQVNAVLRLLPQPMLMMG